MWSCSSLSRLVKILRSASGVSAAVETWEVRNSCNPSVGGVKTSSRPYGPRYVTTEKALRRHLWHQMETRKSATSVVGWGWKRGVHERLPREGCDQDAAIQKGVEDSKLFRRLQIRQGRGL